MEEKGMLIRPRYAVVTGANRGIGLEIVRQLASQGINVILTSRNTERGIKATSDLNNSGLPNVTFHQLDVRDPISISSFAKFIQIQYGKLDILVNNAAASGVSVDAEALRAMNIDPECWLSGKATNMVQGVVRQTYELAEECLDTNYYGLKRLVEALVPLLQLSDSGANLVNVTSLRGELKRMPNPKVRAELEDVNNLTEEKLDEMLQKFLKDLKNGELEKNGWPLMLPSYSMSKTALNAYTRILAKKFPKMCINCVHPGFVNTKLNWNTGIIPAEEGAKGPVKVALLPKGGPSGFYFDETEISAF
ncbi:hypothetical protein AMTRI_Chr01g102710 [Amborella trichopoda]